MGRKPAGWLGGGVVEEVSVVVMGDSGLVVVVETCVESEVEGVAEIVAEVGSEVAVVC